MVIDKEHYEDKIARLKEREKEMKCLYKVQDIINSNLSVDDFLMEITRHIWGGWQYPNIARVKIIFEGKIYVEPGWAETEWVQSADIVVDDKVCGKIEVYYTEFKRIVRDSQFLPEEQKLLNTIANKIAAYIFNLKVKLTLEILSKEEKEKDKSGINFHGLLADWSDIHWVWRNNMVTRMAEKLNLEAFGVKAMYLIGSVKDATCGPASDIDILIHFDGNGHQRKQLEAWFEGWGLCLSEMNFSKTGYKTDGLIDLHIVTDADIDSKNSFASMIGAVNNGAKLLKKI
nr:hypothetical protein [Bacteroidota bacterium]